MIEKPKPKPKRHKMTVACDISPVVRAIVYNRDSVDGAPCCIMSGSPYNLEVAHYISRAQGGKGIPENLVLLETQIHKMYDSGDEGAKALIQERIEEHIKKHYPDWDRSKLVYQKYKDVDPNWLF